MGNPARRRLIEEALLDANFFAVIYFLIMTPAFFLPGGNAAPSTLLLLAPLAFLCQAARHLKQLWLFLLAHLVMASVPLLFPSLWLKVPGMIIMVAVCWRSISLRLKNERAHPSLIAAGAECLAFLIFLLIGKNFGANLEAYAIGASVTVIMACLISTHMQNLDESLGLITKTTVQPTKAILAANNAMILILCLCAAAISIFAAVSFFGKPVNLLAFIKLILGAIVAVINFFTDLFASDEAPIPPEAAPESAPQDYSELMAAPQEPWIIWVILENVLKFVAIAAIVAGIIALIIYLCVTLYRRFNATRPTSDESEFIPPEDLVTNGIKRLKRFIPYFSKGAGVRRLFKRTIKRHMQKGAPILLSDTPEEMSVKIPEDIRALVDEYQAERY
ncbi:MAG: hypothetical protein LBT59_29070 [Clostridiales bacterium]|jgi:hypothetical protein|nr:hypothetical protein [Clostridiales bacterium]